MTQKKAEFLVSAVILLFLVWILWEARNWPAPSKLFPWSVGFSVLLLALVQFGVSWHAALHESRPGAPVVVEEAAKPDSLNPDHQEHRERRSAGSLVATTTPGTPVQSSDSARWRVVTICGWIAAFFLGIWLVGFKAGSLLLTFAFLKFTANEKAFVSAIIAVGLCLFFWIVFDVALNIPLDNGMLGHYFSLN